MTTHRSTSTPTELAAAHLHQQRAQLIGAALKLWAADDKHPERLNGLREVAGVDVRGVFEFVADLMAAKVFPLAPDIRRQCFVVGAVRGMSYSDMSKALDCSTGYISRTMRDMDMGGSKQAVIDANTHKLQKALALFATVTDATQVTAEEAVAEPQPQNIGEVVITPDALPDSPARVIDPVPTEPTHSGGIQPRLQTEDDM